MDFTPPQPSERALAAAQTSVLSAGRLVPIILALLFAIDAYHFVFPQKFVGSPFLRAALGANGNAPFAQNFCVRADRVEGDLVGRLSPSETIGPVVLTTDRLGYRLTPGVKPQAARALIALGNSFLYGSALTDQAALPAQYTRLTAIPTYNSGRYTDDDDGLPELEHLLAHLPQVRRVYLLVLERSDSLPTSEIAHGTPYRIWHRLGLSDVAWRRWIHRPYREIARQVKRRLETSLVRQLGRSLQRRLETWSILPTGAASASAHYLRDGTRLLTRPEEDARLVTPPSASQVEGTASSIAEFCVALKRAGYSVSVVLIPDKLTVYSPYLRDDFAGARNAGTHLDRLQSALRRHDIDVINPLESLQRSVANERFRGCRIYYRDDTHWTACGTEVVAGLMARRQAGLDAALGSR